MDLYSKAAITYKQNGILDVLIRGFGRAYRAMRPHIPSQGPITYAGIPTCYDRKWTDRLIPSRCLPWWTEVQMGNRLQSYEAALLRGLREHVRQGDQVVIVGGGIGVTAVFSARQTGPSGTVKCFEGSLEQVGLMKKTIQRNKIENITINHAVVAESIAVYGDTFGFASVIAPQELPPCDVLELDCEGAEIQILSGMAMRPRVLLIETHGLYGSPTESVKAAMERLGYRTTDLGWAEPALSEICAKDDIRVLLGLRDH